MIGILVFFNCVYKHGFCNHWQYKKLSNLFQYWKIRCGQLRSFSLSGGYMDTCPFWSPSIKSPVQRFKKKKKRIQKYWNVISKGDESDFFFLKREDLHRGHPSMPEFIPWFPPNLPPASAGWIGSEASCRVQQGKHWKLQWCSSSFAFLSRQNCFFSHHFLFSFSVLLWHIYVKLCSWWVLLVNVSELDA